ncbi:hypothetical protein PENTCL1PPCAC_21009, partial [Pristionchus entomophagus]
LLISEYFSNGDLLVFMRERRKYMLEQIEDHDETKIITSKKQLVCSPNRVWAGISDISRVPSQRYSGKKHHDRSTRNLEDWRLRIVSGCW